MGEFKRVNPCDIEENLIKMVSKQWMLITAKNGEKVNTMTASWGGFGEMWYKDVSAIVVRHSRYTYEFLENSDYYTLSFLEEEYRDKLTYCGRNSGRTVDKIRECNFTLKSDENISYFDEAKYVFVCKKLYSLDVDMEGFESSEFAEQMYPDKDIHKMYVGEILYVLKNVDII